MSARSFQGALEEVGSMEQLALLDLGKGEALREKASQWVRANHGVWLWMCGKAMEAATERRRFSISRLVEEARYTKPVKGVDEYRINNDIRAPLARMLIEAVPQCREFIETRDSAVDL